VSLPSIVVPYVTKTNERHCQRGGGDKPGVESRRIARDILGYMKTAYYMEQFTLIAHAKAPEYAWQTYKEAIQTCVRLGKDPTHSKRPMKVVFKPGQEKMKDGLIGGSLHLYQVNKEQQGTVFRIQGDLTASQHKLYKDGCEEAGQRSRLGKGE
jgi:hypothetical protein